MFIPDDDLDTGVLKFGIIMDIKAELDNFIDGVLLLFSVPKAHSLSSSGEHLSTGH